MTEDRKNRLVIRPFEAADMEQVIELWLDCGLVVPWNDPEADISRKINADPQLFLVGEVDGQIAATVMAGYEGHRGWINYLAVAPSLQRSGLGRAVMAEAERKLRERGCPKINLQVRSSNKDVIRFYASLGFKVDDVVSMGKRIIEDKG